MRSVSYFGVTVDQGDGTIAVDNDPRFDPTLSYRENADGDFYPVGPRHSLLNRAIAQLSGTPNVPTVTCSHCQQLLARFGEKMPDGTLKHHCARVLPDNPEVAA